MKTTFMALAAALVSAGGLYAEDAYIEATAKPWTPKKGAIIRREFRK